MLSYTDLKQGTIFVRDGEPCRVLEYEFIRMQQRKPVVQLKIRKLISGKAIPMTAYPSDTFEEAEISTGEARFIYESLGTYWFHPVGNPKERFSLTADAIGEQVKFLKPGIQIKAFRFGEQIIAVELPVKIEVAVTEAPPSVRGNTAQGGMKTVTVETGAKVLTPLFIESGDLIRVNTQTGEYSERAQKS